MQSKFDGFNKLPDETKIDTAHHLSIGDLAMSLKNHQSKSLHNPYAALLTPTLK
ncbi:hypothetical protein [Legionella taurinensis]|uniref:hypothetical protein n=1 Tax=Legionella taurinensis TaxID=70611 RepID=UPI00135855B7|nr:hypothetical protein [Legionella taurinensis]MDX1837446.1 hypothetical protein [Legionella taurinensis]